MIWPAKTAPRLREIRTKAMETADRAATMLEELQSRFPNQVEAISRRFPDLADFQFQRARVTAKAGQHNEAVGLYRRLMETLEDGDYRGPENALEGKLQHARLELGKSLAQLNRHEESIALLTPLRDTLQRLLDESMTAFDSQRWDLNSRFHEILGLYAEVAAELSGPAATETLLKKVREDRLQAIARATGAEVQPIDIAELDLDIARRLRAIGAEEQSARLLEQIRQQLSSLRDELDFATLRDVPAETRRERLGQSMKARRLLTEVLLEQRDEEALQQLRENWEDEMRRFRELMPERGRGRGRSRESTDDGPETRSNGSASAETRPERPARAGIGFRELTRRPTASKRMSDARRPCGRRFDSRHHRGRTRHA